MHILYQFMYIINVNTKTNFVVRHLYSCAIIKSQLQICTLLITNLTVSQICELFGDKYAQNHKSEEIKNQHATGRVLELTHWHLDDLVVVLKVLFSKALSRIVTWALAVKLLPFEPH